MKIALIADTHFGARSDSMVFDGKFKTFFDETFFPTLEKEGIEHVVHLGDVFDRRKYINFQILASSRSYFFDELARRNLKMRVIPGNHDVYYKNTNTLNSLDLLLREYENVSIVNTPEIVEDYDTDILMVPWVTDENSEECMKAIKGAKGVPLCFGHFPIAGFEMHRGLGAEEGLPSRLFRKFEAMYTGHFHHRHTQENISYLGSPYEMTWHDFDDPKGFAILDTETMATAFVQNPNRIHYKIYYDDTKEHTFDVSGIGAGSALKLIVVAKEDYYKFDRLIDTLYALQPTELRVLEEDVGTDVSVRAATSQVDVENVLDLLLRYVDDLENISGDKQRLKSLLRELYVEAQNPDSDDQI